MIFVRAAPRRSSSFLFLFFSCSSFAIFIFIYLLLLLLLLVLRVFVVLFTLPLALVCFLRFVRWSRFRKRVPRCESSLFIATGSSSSRKYTFNSILTAPESFCSAYFFASHILYRPRNTSFLDAKWLLTWGAGTVRSLTSLYRSIVKY